MYTRVVFHGGWVLQRINLEQHVAHSRCGTVGTLRFTCRASLVHGDGGNETHELGLGRLLSRALNAAQAELDLYLDLSSASSGFEGLRRMSTRGSSNVSTLLQSNKMSFVQPRLHRGAVTKRRQLEYEPPISRAWAVCTPNNIAISGWATFNHLCRDYQHAQFCNSWIGAWEP